MLDRDTCGRYEKYLMKEIADRQGLGGYSADASTIKFLCEMCFELIRHVRETMPPEPEPKRKKP